MALGITTMAPCVITVKNISKSFGSVVAVQNLSFEVQANSCFGCLGPNGAGKTTLMKMLYGKCSRDPDSDCFVNVLGYDPLNDELAIKFLTGVVPQDNNLDSELNVIGNLMVYARFYGLARATAVERIEYLLHFMELTEKRNSPIKALSGGMQRRLVIARALLNNPKLLILDEPTTGLDPQIRHLIWDKLRQLKKQGTTILVTTHYMEEAFVLCDKIMIVDKSKAIACGTPKELLDLHVEKYVLEVIGSQSFDAIDKMTLGPSLRIDKTVETMRLYSDNISNLQELAAQLQDTQYYLRETNLEDVFIKATGRKIDEH